MYQRRRADVLLAAAGLGVVIACGVLVANLCRPEIGFWSAGRIVLTAGDALVDALMGPGGVVVLLVFGQDGAQVCLAEDEAMVEKLAAQGTDQALAGRVHSRRLDGGAQDPGAGGLEDGVEGASEV